MLPAAEPISFLFGTYRQMYKYVLAALTRGQEGCWGRSMWRHNSEVKEARLYAHMSWKREGVAEDNKDYAGIADMGLAPQLFIRQIALLKFKVLLF